MHLIVAVDSNWGIGKDGNLLFRIPEDMKQFRQRTLHKIVVMGRKTYESLGCKPLSDRFNIVLTKHDTEMPVNYDNVKVMYRIEDVVAYCEGKVAYCIGGGSIYEQMLPYANTAIVTQVRDTFDADTYFPNLEENPDWFLSKCSETYFDPKTKLSYQFKSYRREN